MRTKSKKSRNPASHLAQGYPTGAMTLGRFLLWFLPMAAALCAAFYVFYRQEVAHEASLLRTDQMNVLLGERRRMESRLTTAASDTLILAQDPLLTDLPERPDRRQMDTARRLLLTLARNKPAYVQVRFLGRDGRELIRLDRAAGGPYPVPEDALQDKSDRYYVREAQKLGPEQVYLSRFDLNVENGRLELPVKPMLRFAAPVRDGRGGVRGLVVINYLGQAILDMLESAWLARGRLELIDRQGYWLMGPRPEELWGFMLTGRDKARLDLRQPRVWAAMQGRARGQFFSDRGLITFVRVRTPVQFGSGRNWFLLARVPPNEVNQALGVYLGFHLSILAGLLLAAALASLLLARAQVRDRLAEARMRRDAENQRALRDLLGLRLGEGPLKDILDQALAILLSVSWLGTLPKGGVFLSEPGDPPALRLTAWRGLEPRLVSMCALVPWGRCHCGRAAATGRLQHSMHLDHSHDNQYPGMSDHGHYCLPLMKAGRCLGAMVLYLDAGRKARPDETDFLEAAARVLAGILESREKEQAVRDSEARLNSVVTTAVEGIVTIDAEGRILSFNPAAEKIFGYAAAEVIGGKVDALQPEAVSVEHGRYIERYLKTGQAKVIGIGREVTGRRKDGSLVPLYLSVSEVRLAQGVMFTGILRDITERKEAERRLQEAKERTEAANRELTRKQRLLDQDLEAAAGIQKALLPSDLPRSSRLDLAWRFLPSQHIGGDMFSVFELSPDHIGMYLLDVSGHGVPSALVTVSVHEMLHRSSGHVVQYLEDGGVNVAEPRWVADMLDQEYPLERFEKFFTMFYAVLDVPSGILRYTNAGHPAPLLFRGGGEVIALETGGSVIGMGQAGGFEQGEIALAPGDCLFCYTDGLTEHPSPDGELYGPERLQAALARGTGDSLEAWVDSALKDALAFGPQAEPQDDISILAVRYLGV